MITDILKIINPPWFLKSACKGHDPDLFYSDNAQDTREAKALCLGCDVRIECRDHALNRPEMFGVWGALTGDERRAVRSGQRGLVEPAPCKVCARLFMPRRADNVYCGEACRVANAKRKLVTPNPSETPVSKVG